MGDGHEVTLYIDPANTEFASESGRKERPENRNLAEAAEQYIAEKLPGIKVAAIKIMLGSVLIASLATVTPPVAASAATNVTKQTVQTQQSEVRVMVDGAQRRLSQSPINRNGTVYVPIRDIVEMVGADVWWNASSKTVGVNRAGNKIAFVVGSAAARVNGKVVPMKPSFIVAGRTMVPIRFLAEQFGMVVSWDNNTKTVSINTGAPPKTVVTGSNYVTYDNYVVKSGDNFWNLSIKFGIPMPELIKANNLSQNSSLKVGQRLVIPVHHVAVKATSGERYGEYLDWWTEAQYVFAINKVATVTDFKTGISFQVKRTIGANHADCEPVTSKDAALMKQVWGGNYSWNERAVLVQVDGRKIAASMASMPHGVEYVPGNNYTGHFDIHFKGSTRHSDGLINNNHQNQIRVAAGIIGG